MPLAAICTRCHTVVEVVSGVTGQSPPCAKCRGPLVPREALVFVCACGVRSKPAQIALTTARPCPKCGKPLVAEMPANSQAPTIVVPPPAGESAAPNDPSFVARESAAPAETPLFAQWTPEGQVPVAAKKIGPASNTVAPASTFGRYEIVRELGRGGMGAVYLARDPQLKREVALKVLLAGEGASTDAIARFVREARAAGQLRHPNIVAVHDAGEIAGQHYFTMDFVRGRELAAVLTAGDSDRATLLGWMRTMCEALHHAHEKGVVHRDLKPQNILIDEAGRPVVMDFGLAKDFSAKTFQSLSGAIMGTPAYMSPEQARGATRELDRRSDVYSLGVILYEITTGRRPFGGNTLFDTMRAVINEDPVSPLNAAPDVDPDLDAIILRCLEKNPAARYQTAKALGDDLGRYLAGESITARRPNPLIQLWKRARRKPALLVSAAAGFLVAIAIAGWLLRPSAVDQLIAELHSPDAGRVRAAATTLSAQLGDGTIARASHRERGLAALRTLAKGSDAEAAVTAISGLLAGKDPLAPPVLLALALSADAPDAVRRAAAGNLAEHFPRDATVAGQLASAVATCDDAGLAAELAAAAPEIEAEAATEALTPVLTNAAHPVRWRIAVIRGFAIGAPPLHMGCNRLFMRLAGDPDPEIGEAGAQALERLRSRETIVPLYGLEGRGHDVAASLGRMAQTIAQRDREMMNELAETEAESDPLQGVLRKLRDTDPTVRANAAFDLGTLDGTTAVPQLTAALEDSDASVRRAAAHSLVRLAPKQAPDLAVLVKLLDSPRVPVRLDVLRLLGDLEAREAVPAIATHVAATDVSERRAALTALTTVADPAGLPAVRTAFAGAGEDTDQSLLCIAALAPRQALGGAALPDLVAALEHRSRAVREAAAAALTAASGERFAGDAKKWQAWLVARPATP